MCTLTARLMRARKRMGCRLSKSIIQAEKECYICRRWYAVKTTRGLEEHHVLNGPLRSFSERHGLKVWLCHQHHNEPGMSPHYNATCAQTLKAVAQAKYEEKNGPGAHAAWMAAVGKDFAPLRCTTCNGRVLQLADIGLDQSAGAVRRNVCQDPERSGRYWKGVLTDDQENDPQALL